MLSEKDKLIILAACECNMNFKMVSMVLGIHRNSVDYRVRKIIKETGLDPRIFDDLIKLREIVKGEEK